MKIILLIGIMILSLATVGYGTSLDSSVSINKIGSEDNASVDRPSANITNMQLRVTGGGAVDRITVTVENQDPINSHIYRVCAFLKAGAETSSVVGSSADCDDTAVANPKGQSNDARNAVINTSIDITIPTNLSDWDISVQEIS